jgi:phage FluMu protein Com
LVSEGFLLRLNSGYIGSLVKLSCTLSISVAVPICFLKVVADLRNMSIVVVCQECRQRFKVSDKFAGEKGPCPKCKAILQVPSKEEEVKIHTAVHSEQGARGKSGELILEPIAREPTQLSGWVLSGVGISLLGAIVVAWMFQGKTDTAKYLAASLGLILLTPPLVLAGYWFLRNSDLEPFQGRGLWVRTGICSLVYILCWIIYSVLPQEWTADLWKWTFLGPIFALGGATAALACFELDYAIGFFHFAFYLGVTALLAMMMGLPVIGG